MKSAAFAYQRPASLADAVRFFGGADGEAKPIAGGQSLGPMLNLRLVRAQLLVDVSDMPEIRTVSARDGGAWIGGAVTHAEIEDGKLDAVLAPTSPLARMMRYVAGTIAYRAVRNRGTLAGSLAHADPAADWVLAMTALDAMRWGYYKFCRKTGEFAEASCASVFDPERGVARIAIGALDGAPALLQKLAGDIARNGIAALTEAAVAEAVASAAPGRDEAQRQLIAASIKRSVKQALGAA
jgi:carbon-monoxide dehydrogenase medium subunit